MHCTTGSRIQDGGRQIRTQSYVIISAFGQQRHEISKNISMFSGPSISNEQYTIGSKKSKKAYGQYREESKMAKSMTMRSRYLMEQSKMVYDLIGSRKFKMVFFKPGVAIISACRQERNER